MKNVFYVLSDHRLSCLERQRAWAGCVGAQVDSCSVPSWSAERVGQWLMSIQMKDYVSVFAARNITGSQLLQLDSSQMKVWRHALISFETRSVMSVYSFSAFPGRRLLLVAVEHTGKPGSLDKSRISKTVRETAENRGAGTGFVVSGEFCTFQAIFYTIRFLLIL